MHSHCNISCLDAGLQTFLFVASQCIWHCPLFGHTCFLADHVYCVPNTQLVTSNGAYAAQLHWAHGGHASAFIGQQYTTMCTPLCATMYLVKMFYRGGPTKKWGAGSTTNLLQYSSKGWCTVHNTSVQQTQYTVHCKVYHMMVPPVHLKLDVIILFS